MHANFKLFGQLFESFLRFKCQLRNSASFHHIYPVYIILSTLFYNLSETTE